MTVPQIQMREQVTTRSFHMTFHEGTTPYTLFFAIVNFLSPQMGSWLLNGKLYATVAITLFFFLII